MSEKQIIEELDDSIFDAYSKKIEEDSKKQKSGNFTPRHYDEIAYCGLEVGVNRVVRLIGAPPGTPGYTRKSYDPLSLYISKKLKNQKGQSFDLRLPTHDELAAKDHIVHRLVAKVNEVEWIRDPSTGKNVKVSKHETKFPELYDAVNHTGYDAKSDPNGYKFCNGLQGKECVVFNVIDRTDDWCIVNKHTKVLVKDVSVLDDGRVFVNGYIPANGFTKAMKGIPELGVLINKYGNYEKYDIAIYRTGQMNPAYKFSNASKFKKGGMLDDLINDDGSCVPESAVGDLGPMTVDEMAYERYDLSHLFQPTSYQKIEKNLGWVFKLCDGTLGTKFYDELEALVEDEKKRNDEIYRNEENKQTAIETGAIKEAVVNNDLFCDIPDVTPVRKPRQADQLVSGLSAEDIKALKGWDKLSPEEQAGIKSVKIIDGTVVDITWTDEAIEKFGGLLKCDAPCNCPTPEGLKYCPACGLEF